MVSAKYRLDYTLLMKIAKTESSLRPDVINRNSNNTNDYGLMQVNDINLAGLSRYGINKSNIMDPEKNIEAAAILLSQHMKHYGGDVFKSVAAYHSKTAKYGTPYANKVLSQEL